MSQQEALIENKVAKSGLVTLDLQKWYSDRDMVSFDMKNYLHMEFVLREKEFREALEKHDWQQYEGKIVAVHCSTDAIIASWAYMLIAVHAHEYAEDVIFGKPEDVAFERFRKGLDAEDWSVYAGRRVLIKGCSDVVVPTSAYLYAAKKLLPFVDRLMYGEACSFVPVYRHR